LNPLNSVEDSRNEGRPTNQSGQGWEHEHTPVASHQRVEFGGVYEAGNKSFDNARELAYQHNTLRVAEQETVVPVQKFAAQAGEKELAERRPMNCCDPRKIFRHGLTDDAGSTPCGL
jgi:hypothetical protein